MLNGRTNNTNQESVQRGVAWFDLGGLPRQGRTGLKPAQIFLSCNIIRPSLTRDTRDALMNHTAGQGRALVGKPSLMRRVSIKVFGTVAPNPNGAVASDCWPV